MIQANALNSPTESFQGTLSHILPLHQTGGGSTDVPTVCKCLGSRKLWQLPEQEVQQNYRQFVQNAPPEMVEQVHQQYYEQMPPQQCGSLMQGLLGMLTQQDYNPQQAGIASSDPSNISPRDAARLTSFAQEQYPDILHQIMGPSGPLGSTGAKLAVAGVAALVAKQLLGAGGFGGLRL
jgi:hypothetical protein